MTPTETYVITHCAVVPGELTGDRPLGEYRVDAESAEAARERLIAEYEGLSEEEVLIVRRADGPPPHRPAVFVPEAQRWA